MAESVNYGISGSVTAQNVAVGQNARLDVRVGNDANIDIGALDPRIVAQLDDLRAAIAAREGDPATRATLISASDEVAAVLAEPEPDKAGLFARLSTIADLAGSTTAIAGAAASLAGLVGMIL